MVFICTDTQRQAGGRQAGSNVEIDRSGEPPMGQASAVAAAQFLTGTLGGNQQQQQQVKVGFGLSNGMEGQLI